MNELITAAYRQPGCNDSALLLQHYRCRGQSLCLACICGEAGEGQGRPGAYLTERILTWFRELPWRRLIREPKRLWELDRELEGLLERWERELKDCGLLKQEKHCDLAGLFCIGECLLLFQRGSYGIFLLNRYFEKGHLQQLAGRQDCQGQGTLMVRRGLLQERVGVLLAARDFYGRIEEECLEECLHVETVDTQKKAGLHLKELGRRAEERGGRHMEAVLVLT